MLELFIKKRDITLGVFMFLSHCIDLTSRWCMAINKGLKCLHIEYSAGSIWYVEITT